MKRESPGPCLSAVFVDYDNIYLSLKRKDDEAARRFAKDAGLWLKEIELGRLITPTGSASARIERRIVMNRCYGNPVPRRNPRDNSTDMSSFPFVRHHFLRAGSEVVDCPPLTAQLKNSSDIRMVMDVRDYLTHETYFDEFIILSGDADFTPVLHRLRAHARRTVIFANEYTAAPYTAICDGEIREQDLIRLLLEGAVPEIEQRPVAARLGPPRGEADQLRVAILNEVVGTVRSADRPVPLETLADRAQRALGHERTIGSSWAGFGSFRSFLSENLPQEIRLTEQAPYVAFDSSRHGRPAETDRKPPQEAATAAAAVAATRGESPFTGAAAPVPGGGKRGQTNYSQLQDSIGRIHEACQAPPLAPPEYRTLFEVMAAEISDNSVSGAQTIVNIENRARVAGLEAKRDDIRFVLDVVSEADPWFEQGVSANVFAGRFRNFAVARCRSQGLALSVEELDLIDAWFAGGPVGPQMAQRAPGSMTSPVRQELRVDQSWRETDYRQSPQQAPVALPQPVETAAAPEPVSMPRFVRSRMR